MGSRRHPLDIFRSTDNGFNHATRQRRTVVGKVLQSTIRSGGRSDGAKKTPTSASERGAGLLGGWRGRRGVKNAKPLPAKKRRAKKKVAPVSPAAARADAIGRQLLYGSGVVVVLFVLVIALRSTFLDEEGGVPQLSANKVLGSREPAAFAAGAHTVLAASYAPNDDALRLAWAAHDELVSRGFDDVLVVSVPSADEPGLAGYQLIVGRASAGLLGDVLSDLRDLNDWPHGEPRPFRQASLKPYPSLDG